MLVSGALDDTKTIGNVGADIFVKSGPEQKPKNWKKTNVLRDFPRFSCGLSQKPVNSLTNGWEPYEATETTHVVASMFIVSGSQCWSAVWVAN